MSCPVLTKMFVQKSQISKKLCGFGGVSIISFSSGSFPDDHLAAASTSKRITLFGRVWTLSCHKLPFKNPAQIYFPTCRNTIQISREWKAKGQYLPVAKQD